MRYVTSLAVFVVLAYVSIALFDAILRGEPRWMEYVVPAVGCGIGMSLAHRSKFRFSF